MVRGLVLSLFILFLVPNSWANPPELKEKGNIVISIQPPYKLVKLQAFCRAPQYEDDTWRLRYDTQSYEYLQAHAFDKQLRVSLVEKDCSHKNLKNSVSKKPGNYEDVHVVIWPMDETHDRFKAQLGEFFDNCGSKGCKKRARKAKK